MEPNNVPHPSAQSEPTTINKQTYRLTLLTLFWCFFTFGLNDGSLGPLLPVYQQYYQIGFVTVSLIFVFNCLGFVLAAVLNVYMSGRISFSKLLAASALFQIVAYAILSTAPPFPLVCFAFYLLGTGLSLLNAHGNGFLSMLKNPTEMGIAHASYGTGALVSPLISTQFSQFSGRKWAFYYIFLLGAVVISLVVIIGRFKGREYDVILSEMGVAQDVDFTTERRPGEVSTDSQQVSPQQTSASEGSGDRGVRGVPFSSVMKQTVMHIMALFIFVYVGVEVTIGGWIVTFIIRERGGGPSSGYINSGFFGGLTLGRIALLWINRKIGEKRVIFVDLIISIGLELTIWFIPSLVENAVAVSLVGMMLGPIYPIVMSQSGRVIPRKLLTGSIGWISAFGGAGAAVVPFITGALAGRFGIQSLQPLVISFLGLMGVLWIFVPDTPKREE